MSDVGKVVLLSDEDREVLGEPDEEAISPEVREHAARPANLGVLPRPDGQAVLTGICEDTMMIQLELEGSRIKDIGFQTNGCGFTLACGSAVTEMARGRSIRAASRIDARQVDSALGGLPKEHMHCAKLAVNTLKAAIDNAVENIRDPWKFLYSGWPK